MKLYTLIKDINCRVLGNTDLDIAGICHKDTEVKDKSLFFCLRGTRVDGINFVSSAIKNGSVAIVTEQELSGVSGITQIIVKNARETMSLIACKFFGNPANKLKIVGVTGTNGKTTITNIIASVLEKLGKKVAIVGTNGVIFSGKKFDTGLTTPDPIELQKYFSQMVKDKIEYVIMEVSAHSLDLNKVSGFTFEVSVFTNLTEDHLDYFKTMDKYFLAKAKLFTKKHSKLAVLNRDDAFFKKLENCINIPYLTYAKNSEADYFANQIQMSGGFQKFIFNNLSIVETQLFGTFNVSNVLASIAVLEALGYKRGDILAGISEVKPVEGRFNILKVKDSLIVIDYAHTPDGLENVLKTCRELASGSKVISVFGCGGNRDSQKRKIMGEISSKNADFTIITSDNPRFEKRETIAKHIEEGMCNSNYIIELERSKAIEKAILMAEAGDVVLVAGKGAEPYIDENGIKIPYSDYVEVEKFRRE